MVPALTLQYLAVTSLVPEINKWQLLSPGQAGSFLEPPSSALLLHLVFLTFRHYQRAWTQLSVSKQYPHPAEGLVEEQSWVQPTPELWGHTEAAGGGQQGGFQALDPVPAAGGQMWRCHAGRIAGRGSQQLPGEAQGSPLHHSSVCPPLPARLDCALTPLAPAGLRENKLHLSQPQFTKCQFQICDTWPLRNQLSFLMPGLDHKWDMISPVAKLSWSQSSRELLTAVPSPRPQLLPRAMNCCRCEKAAESRASCWPHLLLEEAPSRFPPLGDHRCLFSCILLPQLDLEGAEVYEWSL